MKRTSETVSVLAIDDDAAMTEYLSALLESRGYQVWESNRGAEGIRMAKELDPDLIVLDLKMPDLNGLDVCSRIREFSDTPILILSALDEPVKVASALDAGADDYLTKPVASNLLIARLQTLTRRASHQHKSLPSLPTAVV